MASKISKKLIKLKTSMKLVIRRFVSVAEDDVEVQIVKSRKLKITKLSLHLTVKIPIPFILITKVSGCGLEFH